MTPERRPRLRVDANRLKQRIDTLATYVEVDQPPYTRRGFSACCLAAREMVADELQRIGLDTVIDAAGNLVGRLAGVHSEAGPIMIGSHIDTVVGGGRFDGVAGVVAAIEVAETLALSGKALSCPLDVVCFLAEEINEFGYSCIGSRAMARGLDAAMLAALHVDGRTLADAIRQMGGTPAHLMKPLRERGSITAFVELHIEQGPMLDRTEVPIGVVEGIVGIRRHELEILGRQDHAGTTPMSFRADALVAAAAVISFVESAARSQSTDCGFVATVGRIEAHPNLASVIAGRVFMTVEARSLSDAVLDEFFGAFDDFLAELTRNEEIRVFERGSTRSSPAECSPIIREIIRRTATATRQGYEDTPSGAGHDALFMTALCPTGMIFVPSRGGRSHVAEEYTSTEHLAIGAQVLLETVLELDRALGPVAIR